MTFCPLYHVMSYPTNRQLIALWKLFKYSIIEISFKREGRISFATNQSQQISFFDATENLKDQEKRLLEKSWTKYFAEKIFPEIDKAPFSVLYSDRLSRHNTPVNVIIGALILKEIFRLTDEKIVDTFPFDIRYQYALT